MKSPRQITRSRSRALLLRARADDAAALLEAFDGDTGPQACERDRMAWEQLVRVVAERNQAAERAEERERQRPGAKRREKTAAILRKTRAQRSGVVVERVDEGRDVHGFARCLCGAAVRFGADPSELRALGWGSAWLTEAAPPRRQWLCPECWVRPVLVVVPSYRIEGSALSRARARATHGSPRARRKFEALLCRLAEIEPERARAWREQIGAAP